MVICPGAASLQAPPAAVDNCPSGPLVPEPSGSIEICIGVPFRLRAGAVDETTTICVPPTPPCPRRR